MDVGSTLVLEKPQNGLAGLKHWRHDLLARMVVSLVSVPFSLGIAVASGAPPVCGLISAIISG
jgi:carbonic anhydrase